MILTEIKIKDLNVRISEFEDPIFDKNILPVFTTPLILKEVSARKRSKYKIETLNPEKKLIFKVVSFNEVVEELAARINKIAVDLEPHYYIDPSNYNSLPYKVKEIMDKFKLWEEKIEVINASKRVIISTIKKKKLILYARSGKKETIRPILNKKDILNYRNFDFKFDHLISSEDAKVKKNLVKNNSSLHNLSWNDHNPSIARPGKEAENDLLLFSGWIPTSKGALMLLEDQGWDLDLLSNTNSVSQRIRKLRPYKLRIIRRFRRLRRLRLMSINLYLHRSKNVEKIVKDQECQGRNQSMLRLIKVYNGGTMPIKSLSSIINSRIKKLRNVKVTQKLAIPFAPLSFLEGAAIADLRERRKKRNKNYQHEAQLLIQSPNSLFSTKLSQNLTNKFFAWSGKHTDNKLNFIVNWIGDNLYGKELTHSIDNRLNNKNMSNMFLIMQNNPIQLPSIEETKENTDALLPLIDRNQNILNQITLLKAAKNKADAIPFANKSPWEKMRADMLAGTYTRGKYKKYKNMKKMQKRQRYFNNVRFYSYNLTQLGLGVKSILSLTSENININNHKFSTLASKFYANSKLIKHTSTCLKTPTISNAIGAGTKVSTNFRNILTSKTANQLRLASNVSRLSQSTQNVESIGENNLVQKSITSKFKVIPFPQHKNSELTKYLKAIESKINNWNKKKNLSTNLLHKTSLRFAKSQLILKKNNLLSNEYFSLNSMQRKLIKDKLSRILYKNYLNKLKSSVNSNSWKKITTLLKPSAAAHPHIIGLQSEGAPLHSPLLFWTIIKLYSSSFNPMLNSLNNKHFSEPGFFEQDLAQIKLTNRISTTDDEKNSNNTLSFNASSMVASQSLLNNIIGKGVQFKDINNASLSKATVKSFNLLESQTKKKLINFITSLPDLRALQENNKEQNLLAPTVSSLSKASFANRGEEATVKLSHINNGNTEISNDISALIKNVDPKQVYLDLRQADNKRFLFLYFIIPIFFATLKNSSDSATVRAKNLNNQKKQLQTLIKLMLNSRSSLRNQWLYNQNVKLNNISSLSLQSINKVRKFADQNTPINSYSNSNIVNKSNATIIDLLKWSVLFISQSLTPLKRDYDFYNFIFIKILETRGFLNSPSSLNPGKELPNKIIYQTNPVNINSSSALTKTKNINLTNKIVSKTSSRSAAAEKIELNTNKQASITYYPSGRNISDWKNITKAIWQEEYKFNALYKRLKISLNLANNSTNNKSKNLYATIITILKLWKIIKITSIKSVSSFKLQVLFLNYPDFNLRSPRIHLEKRKEEKKNTFSTSNFSNTHTHAQITKFVNMISLQANLSFKKIKYSIIDSIIKVLDKLQTVPKVKGQLRSPISHKLLFNSTLASSKKAPRVGRQIKFGSAHLFNSKFSRKLIPSSKSKFLNLANKIPAGTASAFGEGIGLYKSTKIKNSFFNNTLLIEFNKYFSAILPYLVTGVKRVRKEGWDFRSKKKKLNFISKEINLFMNFSIRNITELFSKEQYINTTMWKIKNNLILTNGAKDITSKNIQQASLTSSKVNEPTAERGSEVNIYNFIPQRSERIEINESFNNLINAKSIIIGKIRSIKLIELIDKMKEEIAIAEKLAALVRVTNTTDLNLINKKKSRRINSNKYLNKKNIYRSNRIKILQTIKTIKSDFRFEPRLDSNYSSNIPVSLLYYSNLKPAYIKNNNSQNIVDSTSIMKDTVHKPTVETLFPNLAPNPRTLQAPIDIIQQTGNVGVLQEFEKPPVISAYLRELSIYNKETKGIINYFSKIVGYNFNTNTNKISSSIYDLLEASFNAMRCLISKPVFIITPEKITIQLFYFLLVANKNNLKIIRKKFSYRRKRKIYKKNRLKEAKKLNLYSLNEVFPEQLELLCGRLNKIFNKPVELNLTRLHYPYEDTNILVNLIGIIINKVHLTRIFDNLFNGSIIKNLTKLKANKYNDISIIPAFLTGLNIKVAGRIMTQGIKPRKTINLKRNGVTASGKINYLNFSRLTNKNKRGSYSITISAGQNYFK